MYCFMSFHSKEILHNLIILSVEITITSIDYYTFPSYSPCTGPSTVQMQAQMKSFTCAIHHLTLKTAMTLISPRWKKLRLHVMTTVPTQQETVSVQLMTTQTIGSWQENSCVGKIFYVKVCELKIWNRTKPRVLLQKQHTRELISAQNT